MLDLEGGWSTIIRLSPTLFFLGFFGQPYLASIGSFHVASFFFLADEYQRGDPGGFVFLIQGHECEIGGCGVTGISGDDILSLHPDTDFHGRSSHHVDAGLDGEKVADIHGMVKIHSVDGGGYHGTARVFYRHDAGGVIDVFHYHAAVCDTGQIGILGLHDVSQDDTAVFDCFSIHK